MFARNVNWKQIRDQPQQMSVEKCVYYEYHVSPTTKQRPSQFPSYDAS